MYILFSIRYLNSRDHEGVTPLMLAVQRENGYMIKFLVAKEAAMEPTDAKGDNIFHFAATKTKDIIEVIIIGLSLRKRDQHYVVLIGAFSPWVRLPLRKS